MTNEEKKEFIEDSSKYLGRAKAFYEDGRDYGMVTIMFFKTWIATPTIAVYDEANGNLVSALARSAADGEETAPCGRRYGYICPMADGTVIFVEPID